jgi:predicted transcriptional regulator
MGEVPLSLHVSADVKMRLEREAARTQETESEIAGRAIDDYLARRDAVLKMLKDAGAEADKGVFVSSEAVLRWMESWNDDGKPELPFPEPDVFLPPRR